MIKCKECKNNECRHIAIPGNLQVKDAEKGHGMQRCRGYHLCRNCEAKGATLEALLKACTCRTALPVFIFCHDTSPFVSTNKSMSMYRRDTAKNCFSAKVRG